jgi:hypothetical protein
MSAEQFVDAVSTVTGVWPEKKDARLTPASERFGRSKWVWSVKGAEKDAPPATIYLRLEFEMKAEVVSARAVTVCDNQFELWLNGKSLAKGDKYDSPEQVDLQPHLRVGRNVLAVAATNTSDKPNPAGFWFNLEAPYARPVPAVPGAKNQSPVPSLRVVTGSANWKVATTQPANQEAWKSQGFDDAGWPSPVVVGDINAEPWKLAGKLPDDDAESLSTTIRTSMLYSDPLTTALGRPAREQVNTVRPSVATTLQMLELTNGPTLADMLSRGAKNIASVKDLGCEDVIRGLYAKALGREPTVQEMSLSMEVLGSKVTEDGVEDLLWAVMMLPEFQLIR